MNSMQTRSRTSPGRGFSTVEVIICVALFAIMGVTVAVAMTLFGRASLTVQSQTRIQDNSRRFAQELQFEASEAQAGGVIESGAALQLIRPDNSVVQYAYVDADSNANTIANNSVIRRTTLGSNANGEPKLTFCSRVTSGGTTLPVFAFNTAADRTLINVVVRSGDRNTAGNTAARVADDLQTGRGFQSFVVNTCITPGSD
jgi:Tfp pilus assembly protein FimT